jgi:superfamily II DNA or RNA helicase
MWYKFRLKFEQISRERIDQSRTGNPFQELDLVIARLDQMARNDDILAKLEATEWDLVVCDEAHKMSASVWGREIKRTKRYELGRLLSKTTRHFLLLTATPHNGKEADFQLFMALLDPDRFEGRYREGVHRVDCTDLMRRMVKEHLLTFEGTPLFPERRAYSVKYRLSPPEAQLYSAVTDYVREEFNRAERLDEGRRGTVGFALTTLQRRLASSPAAIAESLRRRRERLDKRLQAAKAAQLAGAEVAWQPGLPELTPDDVADLEESEERGRSRRSRGCTRLRRMSETAGPTRSGRSFPISCRTGPRCSMKAGTGGS